MSTIANGEYHTFCNVFSFYFCEVNDLVKKNTWEPGIDKLCPVLAKYGSLLLLNFASYILFLSYEGGDFYTFYLGQIAKLCRFVKVVKSCILHHLLQNIGVV